MASSQCEPPTRRFKPTERRTARLSGPAHGKAPGAGPGLPSDPTVRSGGLLVHLLLGELGEKIISFLLLLQGLVQQLHGVVEAKLPGPGLQGAVAGDLVVLDRLRGRKKACVQRVG